MLQSNRLSRDARKLAKNYLPQRVLDFYRMVRYPGVFELAQGPLTYNQDGLATIHSTEFLQEQRFIAAYEKGARTGSFRGMDPRWRAHTDCWAAYHAMHLEGDFIECGVYRGAFTTTYLNYVNFKSLPKRCFLLDTFEGKLDETLSEEEVERRAREGIIASNYEAAVETFKEFPNVKIIKGFVPDTLPQVDTDKVAFLHLDMNNAPPEVASAEFFWDKLVHGAVVMLDDYAYKGYEAQKTAMDAFADRKGIKVLSLPTGQGMFLKP